MYWSTSDMGRRAIFAIAIVAAVALAACAPSANYEDPLAQIGRSVSVRNVSDTRAGSPSEPKASPFKTLTLGVIFTDNTKHAM
jgi:hypothetical protein